jgi:hypothetical protein
MPDSTLRAKLTPEQQRRLEVLATQQVNVRPWCALAWTFADPRPVARRRRSANTHE